MSGETDAKFGRTGLVEPGPSIIGFRLDEPSRRALSERAARLKVSPHELARFYLTEVLADSEERRALREAICILREELSAFRRDFVFSLSAMLTSAGKVEEGKAEAWIKKNFRLEE